MTLDAIEAETSLAILIAAGPVRDRVALTEIGEIGPGHPDGAVAILGDKHPYRPIEPGQAVRGQELDAERRIAEQQQLGGGKRDASARAELPLVDLVEEFYTLGGDIGLDARNGGIKE